MSKELYEIMPGSAIDYEGDLYIADLNSNALYRFNIENDYVEWITTFHEEDGFEKNLYTEMLSINNILYCVPHAARTIGIYDIKNNYSRTVNLPSQIANIPGKFKTAIYCEGEIFFLGYTLENVWSYNINDNTFKEIIVPESKKLFVKGICVRDKIYFISKASSNIWILDCKTKYIIACKTCLNNEGLSDIFVSGGIIYVISFDSNKIYKFESNGLKDCHYIIKLNSKKWPHGVGIEIGGKYLTLSIEKEKIILNDLQNFAEEIDDETDKYNDVGISNLIKNGENILVWLYGKNDVYIYYPDKNVVKKKLFACQKPVRKINNMRGAVYKEDSVVGVKEFIEAIK